jgi:CheY-like chemotaxis protein
MERTRLLLVDDSVPIRRLVGELAVELGYQVVGEAGDGVAGAAAAVRLEPDVVVMDWQMPELDGVQATRVIHERCPAIEVIAFSSADDEVVADAFRKAGASAYVEKADVDGLIEELERRLSTHRRRAPG